MTPADFIREVAGPGRRPLYIVSGGEPSATAKCLAAAAGAVEPSLRDFNFQTLELEPGQAGSLLGAAATRPFGGPPRIVAAKNPPFEADDWNALAAYLENPNPETSLILVLDKPDARLRFIKKAQAGGLEVDCRPPQGPALARWLAAEFKSRGVAVSPETARLIIERAGEDPGLLLGEAEKLSLYLGEGQTLSADLVKALVSPVLDAQLYNLTDRLTRRQFRAALADLLEIMSDNRRDTDKKTRSDAESKAHMVLAALENRLLTLAYFRNPPASSAEADELTPKFIANLSPRAKTLAREQAPRWPQEELSRALAELEEVHRALITSDAPSRATLENFILKLAGPPPARY